MSQPGTTNANQPSLLWDIGTAYELFVSLHVLHEPDYYGIRASWAAGVRSRIPAAERKLLDEVMPFMPLPIAWIRNLLPAPKDALSALWAIRQIPPAERILTLLAQECYEEDNLYLSIVKRVMQRCTWDEQDISTILDFVRREKKEELDKKKFALFLDWCTRPEAFGEGFLSSLQAYYQGFFEQEEKRVGPVLKNALQTARELSQNLSVHDLLVALSQGVHFAEVTAASEIILIPAYWITPLVLFQSIGHGKKVFLFGARPANMSAIPGEMVPDDLVRVLKATADPTRLKILYYLSREELTPSELARRLHLRAPTITHHLNELRLAGLVNLTLSGQERRYSIRREALDANLSNLGAFLDNTVK